jgi:hypothetical protein
VAQALSEWMLETTIRNLQAISPIFADSDDRYRLNAVLGILREPTLAETADD